MKPFDLEAAKRGEPIQARDGRKARFIAHLPECSPSARVVALVDGQMYALHFSECGRRSASATTHVDLFMAPKKRTVWVNFYGNWKAEVFPTEKDAIDDAKRSERAVKTYPIDIEVYE